MAMAPRPTQNTPMLFWSMKMYWKKPELLLTCGVQVSGDGNITVSRLVISPTLSFRHSSTRSRASSGPAKARIIAAEFIFKIPFQGCLL